MATRAENVAGISRAPRHCVLLLVLPVVFRSCRLQSHAGRRNTHHTAQTLRPLAECAHTACAAGWLEGEHDNHAIHERPVSCVRMCLKQLALRVHSLCTSAT